MIDANIKQEMIPISAKDEFLVSPYVGKEGTSFYESLIKLG